MPLRVLSWNLYHGRDFPPDPALLTLRSRLLRITERNATHAQVNRPLLAEFAGWIADREWDVALLQEAPPRWFRELCCRTGSNGAGALTSRNVVPLLQGLAADLNPDLIASWEGGSNQLLVRAPGRIAERRRMIWARVELPRGGRVCFANLHASAGLPAKAGVEVVGAAAAAVEWSGDDPLVFGGDLNLRPAADPHPFDELRERFGLAGPTGPHAIDHLLARGLELAERPRRLPSEAREVTRADGLRVRLSDHAPVSGAWEVAPRAAVR